MEPSDRISVIGLARPYIPLAAPPDGVISAADRALMAHGYAGILVQHPLPFLSPRWAVGIVRRAAIQASNKLAVAITPPPVLVIAAESA